MKQGKKPTAAQKAWLSEQGLSPKEWLIVQWANGKIIIVHRTTQEVKNFAV